MEGRLEMRCDLSNNSIFSTTLSDLNYRYSKPTYFVNFWSTFVSLEAGEWRLEWSYRDFKFGTLVVWWEVTPTKGVWSESRDFFIFIHKQLYNFESARYSSKDRLTGSHVWFIEQSNSQWPAVNLDDTSTTANRLNVIRRNICFETANKSYVSYNYICRNPFIGLFNFKVTSSHRRQTWHSISETMRDTDVVKYRSLTEVIYRVYTVCRIVIF